MRVMLGSFKEQDGKNTTGFIFLEQDPHGLSVCQTQTPYSTCLWDYPTNKVKLSIFTWCGFSSSFYVAPTAFESTHFQEFHSNTFITLCSSWKLAETNHFPFSLRSNQIYSSLAYLRDLCFLMVCCDSLESRIGVRMHENFALVVLSRLWHKISHLHFVSCPK